MSLREELQALLLEWAFEPQNDGWTDGATRLFFRPDLGPVLKLPWFRDLFPDWLVHDYVDPEGRTLARRYLREHFLELEPVETRILKTWSPGELRLLEVSRVRRGRGVVCRDLYRDGQVELRDGTLAARSATGDVLLARVIRDPDCTRVAYSLRLPLHALSALERGLRSLAARTGHRPASLDPATLLRHDPLVVIHLLATLNLQELGPPELRTTDGEPLVFCRAEYRILDPEALHRALAGHRSFPEEEDGYTWISGTKRKGPFKGDRIVLGNLRIRSDELRLETQSRPRLTRGRRLLEKLAGPCLQHVRDTFRSHLEVMAESPPPEEPSEDDLPEELKERVMDEFLTRYYSHWPDQPIPVLEDRTPRQAAAEPRLRPTLIALMREYEQSALRLGRNDRPHLQRIRRELGLPTD